MLVLGGGRRRAGGGDGGKKGFEASFYGVFCDMVGSSIFRKAAAEGMLPSENFIRPCVLLPICSWWFLYHCCF